VELLDSVIWAAMQQTDQAKQTTRPTGGMEYGNVMR
jgi:hypothetical protein